MDIPSRIQIRRWLVENTRAEILQFLEEIKIEHGEAVEQDVRNFLNVERQSDCVDSPGERSLLSENEQRKADIKADIESQKKLYSDDSAEHKQSLAASGEFMEKLAS